MPQYLLTRPHALHGITLAQGCILSTDAPPASIFYVSPQDAERLMDEGVLSEHEPEVLTGARSREPGWTPLERREPGGELGGDVRAPWG